MTGIVILTHPYDRLHVSSYFLRFLADLWRQDGLSVTVISDPDARVEADLAFLHVDLTVVPEAYLRFMQRYPVAVNGGVKDISKRVISEHLVQHDSDYSGPVIVKTNQNSGGYTERRLARRQSFWSKIAYAVGQRLPWSQNDALRGGRYSIFESIGDVPIAVWQNDQLVVERFLPECREGSYCLRTWCFLGDRETNSICYSREPIIKSSNVERREIVPEVPARLRELRRKWSFDYGKFDYVMHDDEVILYDANRTPTMGRFDREKLMPGLRVLAQGVHSLMSPSQPSQTGPACVGHWPQAARLWKQVGPPLRPRREDTEFLISHLRAWTQVNGPPRALILGVTPEIFHLPWPADADVKAVDHTPLMIESIWPGPRADVLCAAWTDIPLEDASRDLIFCDGGIHLMGHPDEQRAFVRSMRRIVSPGGLCLFRLFVPPAQSETPQHVLDELMSGNVANLNVLKLRLGMALQRSAAEGVALHEVWDTLRDRAPDFDALAEQLNWEREHLLAINTYRDSPTRYHFVSTDDVEELFCRDGGFRVADTFTPSYPLGERCPTLVLRRENDPLMTSAI